MKTKRQIFRSKTFSALLMAYCAIGLCISGVANHTLSLGPMSMGRHFWMSAHNVLGLLFVAAAVWHCQLNRRVLWNHLQGAAAFSREAKMAGAIVVFALLVFAGHALHM